MFYIRTNQYHSSYIQEYIQAQSWYLRSFILFFKTHMSFSDMQ